MRNSKKIAGFSIGDKDHKVVLYADDMVLYVTKPTSSLKCILHILNEFGKLFSLFRNCEKSEIDPVCLKVDTLSYLHTAFKFQWVSKQ